MTYVSAVTFVAYLLLVGLLIASSVIDIRTRRIPNALTLAIIALWAVWRVVLGFSGQTIGLGFTTAVVSPAPDLLVPPGLYIGGASLADGLVGAVILGGGLLVLTVAYEAVTRKEAFGGGDIKLLAAVGLFIGWERGLICVFVACVLSVLYALAKKRLSPGGRVDAAERERREAQMSGSLSLATRAVRPSESSSFGGTTIPFAPFIALGTLVAFVA